MDKQQLGGICGVGSILAFFVFCSEVAQQRSANETIRLLSLILTLLLLAVAVVDSKKWLWLLVVYPIVTVGVAIANFRLEF